MRINRARIGVVILVIVLLAGAVIYYGKISEQNQKSEYGGEQNITNFKVDRYGADLKPNTKPQFRVGEKFRYNVTLSKLNNITTIGEVIYSVDKIDEIGGVACFVIKEKRKDHCLITGNTIAYERMTYIDKETGDILQIDITFDSITKTIKKDKASALGNDMYAPWTLALEEGLKWNEIINVTQEHLTERILIESEYEVIGKEKLYNRDCFKIISTIKTRVIGTGVEKELITQKILWVDVEKRILVKAQSITADTERAEMNLLFGL